MKLVILWEKAENMICVIEEFQKKLACEGNQEVLCLQYNPGEHRDIIGEIKALQPDLLITVDLAGFEQCTLTDNIAYNLLDCKQLHLLLHRDLSNEHYLNRPLNIAMFFYCAGEDNYEYLQNRYPDLPYLKKLPKWQQETASLSETDQTVEEKMAQALYEAYREVLREGMLQG